ncbi:MAG TPA: hypothetical protein VFK06_08170 [Candidatus Angelobacter sp.]|nr:hypothetical protein [Candidatus Angelobacter sp.]
MRRMAPYEILEKLSGDPVAAASGTQAIRFSSKTILSKTPKVSAPYECEGNGAGELFNIEHFRPQGESLQLCTRP